MIKKILLTTGVILFAFLTCHLLNLSFGLVSLAALDDSRLWFLWFWSTDVGIILLSGSFVIHIMLGFFALYRRNTLRMRRGDAAQLILGLIIFPLLFGHLVGTVMAPMMTGTRQSYFSILTLFWVIDPVIGLKQILVTVITWIHGCIGLVVWMRIQPWWSRVAGFIYPLVVAIPLVAMLGMVVAGREVIKLNEDAAFTKLAMNTLASSEDQMDSMQFLQLTGLAIYFAALAFVLIARYYRVRKYRITLRVTYPEGVTVDAVSGLTLLEISRMNNIPHASMCGGKERCGTCRVRIHAGMNLLPDATEAEQNTLNRVKAEPDTRLACQSIPQSGAISIEPLLPAYIGPKDLSDPQPSEIAPIVGNPLQRDAK